MSLYIEFELHSWYKGFAIKRNDSYWANIGKEDKWEAYTDNGNTYSIDTVGGSTLKELKKQITEYRSK